MRKSTPESPRPDGAAPDIDPDTASTEQALRRNDRLPHERDESARATGDRLKESPTPSDQKITQAGADVEAGRVDTERRGVPSDVPKSS